MQEIGRLLHRPRGRHRRPNHSISPPVGKHRTPGSAAVGISSPGQAELLNSLNRGGLETVSGGCGFRRAGERRSAGGKDPNAGAVGLEKRCRVSSVLW